MGSTTSAAAALDMGWVSRIVSSTNPGQMAVLPKGLSQSVMSPARNEEAPVFSIARPKALMPPMRMSSRQSIEPVRLFYGHGLGKHRQHGRREEAHRQRRQFQRTDQYGQHEKDHREHAPLEAEHHRRELAQDGQVVHLRM
jgi:hypothetical protein